MSNEGGPDKPPPDATSDPHNLPLILGAVVAGLIALAALFWGLANAR